MNPVALNEPEKHIAKTILMLKQGDEMAFREVFNLYQRRLYCFIFSMTKSDCATEDILQEVFFKIWVKHESLNLSASFDAFIYTIAKNLTYNHLRNVASQRTLKKELWRNLSFISKQTENDILSNEYDEIVSDILKNIPVQKRSIFILSKQQGKSNNEIADLLGISPKTVKNHLWKTLQLIREQLKPHLTDSIVSVIYLISFFS